jgi:diguanylate cyclase (GGDEF)-like protein
MNWAPPPKSSERAVPASPEPENDKAAAYAPYAQLVKMLLPSAGSIAVYDARAELLWCSDGYERPDLRELLEQQRESETLASRGRVDQTSSGVPVYISALRAPNARPLGSVVIELGRGSSRSTPSMVVSMLRPVLDCLESRLALETAPAQASESPPNLELLLTVDEQGRQDTSAVADLLRTCVQQLGCVTGALLVPDKNLEFSCTGDDSAPQSQLLDRTQKHLLAWAQLNNRPMVVNRGAGGGDATYKILSCPVRDAHGRVIGLTALFRASSGEDFEQRDIRILEFVSRRAVAILESEHDALTGLVNRYVFERRAQGLLDRQGWAGVLLYADIDKLAAINEAFGLGAGDEVLQRVGDLVRRAAGPGALVSRVAGDCFAAMLTDRTLLEAEQVASTIAAAVSQIGYVQGADALPVSVSIGAVEARSGERIAHLLAAGELACRRAKGDSAGRRVALGASPAGPAALQLHAASLHDALRSNGFQLDAQPLVSLQDALGQPAGYELLIRLRGAGGELLAPDKFMHACEQFGLLPALDRWTLCAAVEALRSSPLAHGSSGLFFAVNVSAQSVESRNYAAFAVETLAAAGLDPRGFCFELKEGAAVANLAAAEALIRDLAKAGAKVALDDFGSGLSSLAHLKRLPVDYLKIDGRFVRRMAADRVAESIVAAIASAAKTLGVVAVAEHVESEAVALRLRALGVTLAQGFHFGRPMPLVALVEQAVTVPPARASTRA